MSRSLLRSVTALALTALMLAAHAPVPGATASKMTCCGPQACCQAERACTSGGACANHSDHARSPILPGFPSLLAGNCGDPTPRVAPVSYDPVTQPRHTAVRTEASIAELPIVPTHPAPEHGRPPSVPPPRA